MGVSEEDSPVGQSINVGRPGIGMPPQTANPVIEVIDGDEEDIWFPGWPGILARCNKRK